MRFAADLIKIKNLKKNRVKRLNTLNEKIFYLPPWTRYSILTSKCFCLTLTVFSWAGTCTVFNLQTFEFIIRHGCELPNIRMSYADITLLSPKGWSCNKAELLSYPVDCKILICRHILSFTIS